MNTPRNLYSLDTLGVFILPGDTVRVIAWGAPVRVTDVGAVARVVGFTRAGNVRLDCGSNPDPIARGRAVSPGYLAVARRDGAPGHEGNAA
jgi:hypothetical protein